MLTLCNPKSIAIRVAIPAIIHCPVTESSHQLRLPWIEHTGPTCTASQEHESNDSLSQWKSHYTPQHCIRSLVVHITVPFRLERSQSDPRICRESEISTNAPDTARCGNWYCTSQKLPLRSSSESSGQHPSRSTIPALYSPRRGTVDPDESRIRGRGVSKRLERSEAWTHPERLFREVIPVDSGWKANGRVVFG